MVALTPGFHPAEPHHHARRAHRCCRFGFVSACFGPTARDVIRVRLPGARCDRPGLAPAPSIPLPGSPGAVAGSMRSPGSTAALFFLDPPSSLTVSAPINCSTARTGNCFTTARSSSRFVVNSYAFQRRQCRATSSSTSVATAIRSPRPSALLREHQGPHHLVLRPRPYPDHGRNRRGRGRHARECAVFPGPEPHSMGRCRLDPAQDGRISDPYQLQFSPNGKLLTPTVAGLARDRSSVSTIAMASG